MRHLIRVTGFIITLALLLAVVVGSSQACQERHELGKAMLVFTEFTEVSTDDGEQVEDTALVCLALVGGTALLAGIVWMRKLRRMLS